MSRTAEIETFKRLKTELSRFVELHPFCAFERESEKELSLRLGKGEQMSLLHAQIGSFVLDVRFVADWDHEDLVSSQDVDRVLAMCDAVVAGRGVSVSGPDGYPVRSWLFLQTRGFKEAMTSTATSIPACLRGRRFKKSQWRRERLPALSSEIH